MSLRILKAGLLDTIQDQGRCCYQHVGINPTGAMDKFAAAIANILVGNHPRDAIIEMHFPGPAVLFQRSAIIALSGADFAANINGHPVPLNHPLLVNENMVLQFSGLKTGSHCYLAIGGKWKLDKWLDSYSTNLKAEAGGLSGRKLIKDDIIEWHDEYLTNKMEDDFRILPWQANEDYGIRNTESLLVLRGSEWDWLDDVSRQKFQKNPFYISPNSDRMGYRLASEPLHTKTKAELVSAAVSFGTIQLLPDGQLIVLMADHQTTGGYPRLGNIISSNLPLLAQMKPGDKTHFNFTDHETAESLLIKQKQHLLQLEIACKLKLEKYIYENN